MCFGKRCQFRTNLFAGAHDGAFCNGRKQLLLLFRQGLRERFFRRGKRDRSSGQKPHHPKIARRREPARFVFAVADKRRDA